MVTIKLSRDNPCLSLVYFVLNDMNQETNVKCLEREREKNEAGESSEADMGDQVVRWHGEKISVVPNLGEF